MLKCILGTLLLAGSFNVRSFVTPSAAFFLPSRGSDGQEGPQHHQKRVGQRSSSAVASKTDDNNKEVATPEVPSIFTLTKEVLDDVKDFDASEVAKDIKEFNPAEFVQQAFQEGTSEKGKRKAGQKKRDEQRKSKSWGYIESMVGNFKSLVSGSGTQETIAQIVSTARERSDLGDVEDTTSLPDIFKMLNKYKDEIKGVTGKFLGDIDFSTIAPTGILYYLEREDERKNPSWKRRIHRFCPGIDIDRVEELNDDYELARLSYGDTVDNIRQGLANFKTPYELVFASVASEPGSPAHYVAVPQSQPSGLGAPLEVLLAVRGTKDLADAITDMLCDTVEYREGKSHALISESGKYVFEQHRDLLQELLKKSDRQNISLKIVGHSLGAGAASIAGIEFHEETDFDVEVVGFGCPPLLSEILVEKYDFITTVVNDADVVPRVSGVTVANLLLDILEFDWYPYAKRDIAHVLEELERIQPVIFNNSTLTKIDKALEKLMENMLDKEAEETLAKRLTPELFLPGNCIHFYRDGSGISGCYVPNTFFTEIDLNRRMINDHLSDSGYLQTFLEVMREQTGDKHFRFENSESD